MSERIITVNGTGNVSVNPDLIIITMSLTTSRFDYSQAMDRIAAKTESLRNALISIGYEGKKLKTTAFNINTKYESYKDSKGDWKQKFAGYSCSHDLKLEFDLDMKRFGETLGAISASTTSPQFQIAFSVKDKNAVQKELLERAVSNAADKAAILAKASGVTLGAIRHIDYSWSEVRLYSHTTTTFNKMALMESKESFSMDIEPEDIEVNDTVTVMWDIQ